MAVERNLVSSRLAGGDGKRDAVCAAPRDIDFFGTGIRGRVLAVWRIAHRIPCISAL
jgi:hypothetical protein